MNNLSNDCPCCCKCDTSHKTNMEVWRDFEEQLKKKWDCRPEDIGWITAGELTEHFNCTHVDIIRLRTEAHQRGLTHFGDHMVYY